MGTAYQEDELLKLLASHLTAQGFKVELEKIIDEEIHWRPDVFAERDESEFAIDIRLNDKITDFWLT
ncbi:hypothetical protein KA005_74140, partial [bacterium]|nr:hypothetical protein [bacterium]